MANIFEFLSKDGNITPEKARKSRQTQFRDKTAYVWGLRYRWDPSLSRNPVPRFPHFMPPWSQLNLRFKILTKPSIRILTKILLHKLYKTSAAKCWTNSSFKVLPELRLQPLGLRSEQKCSFRTKRQSPNLQQTVANTILITNISNSNNNNLNKFWLGIFTRQDRINQVY